MRYRIHVLAFAITLAAAASNELGRPAVANATITPTTIQWQFCCERGSNHCCGASWCAITASGCASG